MCNHYRGDPSYREAEVSEIKIPPFRNRGPFNSVSEHVYPGRDGEIIAELEGELANAAAHWRYVPPHWTGPLKEWAKRTKPGEAVRGASCNNARGETADTGRMWRHAAQHGRCLIPARSFFEYGAQAGPDGKKIEYQFNPAAGGTLWLGGLCGWAHPEEGRMLTYTMVTKPCGPDTSSIGHQRQPVNLAGDQLAAWLDPANPVAAFLEVSPAGTFQIEAVPPRAPA